jgi:tRNA uridine 5-carbamoylmethylation protein Kti12
MTDHKLIIVIGAYGSGKSEYSINLAKDFNDKDHDVVLCDMDVVNPYFRSRDVREQFEEIGIQVVAPEGEFKHADLPMISPRIRGMIMKTDRTVVLDVGGDPAGARTLGRFVPEIKKRGYELHFVINTNRPFTSNVAEIKQMMEMIESLSTLKVTELICNSNLMEFTDESVVKEGVEIVNDLAEELKLPFNKYLVLEKFSESIPQGLGGKERVVLKYFLNKPWEEKLIYKGI